MLALGSELLAVFNKLSGRIASKLYYFAFLSLLAVASLAIASIYFSRTTQDAVNALYSDGLLFGVNSGRLNLMIEHHRRIVESMPLEVDRKRLHDRSSELEQVRLGLQTFMDDVAAKHSATDRDGIERQIAESLPALWTAGEKVAFYAHEFAQDKATEGVEEYSRIASEIQLLIERYRDLRLREARNSIDIVSTTVRSLAIWVLLCALAAMILIGTLCMVARPIGLSRLSGITEAMARLARNEVAIAIPSRDDSDEVGDMARAVEVFKDNAIQLMAREIELKELNRRMDSALNNMTHGLCMFDAEQKLIVCNQAYAKMYDLTPELTRPGTMLRAIEGYLVGTGNGGIASNAAGAFKGDPDQYIAKAVDHAKAETEVVQLPDGRIVSVTNAPTPNGGWLSIHDDVTERRQLEQERDRSQKFLNTILENAPIPIFVKE